MDSTVAVRRRVKTVLTTIACTLCNYTSYISFEQGFNSPSPGVNVSQSKGICILDGAGRDGFAKLFSRKLMKPRREHVKRSVIRQSVQFSVVEAILH